MSAAARPASNAPAQRTLSSRGAGGGGVWPRRGANGEDAAPAPRAHHSAVAGDAVMVVFGGCGPGGALLAGVHLYHPEAHTWLRASRRSPVVLGWNALRALFHVQVFVCNMFDMHTCM